MVYFGKHMQFKFVNYEYKRKGLKKKKSQHLQRRRQWHPTPILLPGKSQGQRSLVGYSPWALEESDMTERLHFHFSLSCIGEGNGNPLQCSCMENPRDGGAWWAAVYGVAQSQTQLKRLSSSSSSSISRASTTMFQILCLGLIFTCHVNLLLPTIFQRIEKIPILQITK